MFVLAVAAGQVLAVGSLDSVGILLLSLVLVASVACVFELDPVGAQSPWTPVAEGVLAAILMGTTQAPVVPLLIYLVAPPVIAGLRHGWVTTANTALASGAAMLGAWGAADALGNQGSQMSASLPWLAFGLGAGLMASWLGRSVRQMEDSQAPYAAAHHLVSQLHTLATRMPVGLDALSVARTLHDEARLTVTVERSALILKTGDDTFDTVVAEGPVTDADEKTASICVWTGRPRVGKGLVALPLRVGEHCFGALLLARTATWSKAELSDLQALADTQAVRLDTALLFDDVRSMATSEERNRLARDIHDGVAQEIVSLGYLADEIADTSGDASTRQLADDLRAEITRVVSELRFSIFDLRHDLDEASSVSGALAEYVREVSHQSGLRVHLLFDERGPRLSQRVEQELLRIGQEAIGNVRKHARAINLWVTLTSDGKCVRLVIEDDGVGAAVARQGHYGLHTMRERAERIDADFSIAPRPDGGTVVTVQSRNTSASPEDSKDDHTRPAHR
ncbi:hypothetical protein ASH02_13855 [Nocardioides sp. Soil796]|nr:hypothetical protein ASH02_13855 [Nocardioides sp. Soil796]